LKGKSQKWIEKIKQLRIINQKWRLGKLNLNASILQPQSKMEGKESSFKIKEFFNFWLKAAH